MEDEKLLVNSLKSSLGNQEISLAVLADVLHSKDYYGSNKVSAPQLRSAMRSMGMVLDNNIMTSIMKATDIEGKKAFFIPAILDILNKCLGNWVCVWETGRYVLAS